MSLSIVVGGQYGSEGKGKVAAIIATRQDVDIAVRCGGPNSGHSFVTENGAEYLVRQVPTAFINRRTRLLIPAGATVDLDVLRRETELLGIAPERLGVDVEAMIIDECDKNTERILRLGDRISSTLCGVGSAIARRVLRGADVTLAKDAAASNPWLANVLASVSEEVNEALDRGKRVLVEGTQGFGLSLFHSGHYPKTTSKDTSASAFLSEVGVSPRFASEIVLVMRTFPIRVAGAQAGPLNDEITWDQLQAECQSPTSILEYTSVTKKVRRLGRFDWNLACRAVRVNRPTSIAINCIDHLTFADHGVKTFNRLSQKSRDFVSELERRLRVPVRLIGTGPSLADTFERISDPGLAAKKVAS
ncbi:MAG TPA: adenylosuccinate synthetase [Candidatus Binatia bacterium]|nr:adenylosuccinate synthetase [Candidatus Binatia bacterium]